MSTSLSSSSLEPDDLEDETVAPVTEYAGVEFDGSVPQKLFRWTLRREKILAMRLQGKTWKEIAREVGMAEVSCSKLGKRPEFLQAMSAALDDVREATIIYLQQHTMEAAFTEVDLMRNGDGKRDEVKLDAARDILDRMNIRIDANAPAAAIGSTGPSINVNILNATEDAFAAAIRQQPVHLGDDVWQGHPPVEGSDPIRALPVPREVSSRQE